MALALGKNFSCKMCINNKNILRKIRFQIVFLKNSNFSPNFNFHSEHSTHLARIATDSYHSDYALSFYENKNHAKENITHFKRSHLWKKNIIFLMKSLHFWSVWNVFTAGVFIVWFLFRKNLKFILNSMIKGNRTINIALVSSINSTISRGTEILKLQKLLIEKPILSLF